MGALNIPPAPPIEGTVPLHSGKVRDLYRIAEGEHVGRLLMVASDRIYESMQSLDDTPSHQLIANRWAPAPAE